MIDEPKKSEMKYGTGTVFLPKGRNNWRIQYWVDGRRHIESSGSPDRRKAVKLLRARLKRPVTTAERRATFNDLVELLRGEYRRKENRTLDAALRSVAHLRVAFERVPAARIDFAQVDRYINSRLDAGAAHATVRRERAILAFMLRLAVEAEILPHEPKLPKMGESNNARQGFFEQAEFDAVLAHLAEPLRPLMRFLYLTGWRSGEAKGLTWKQVDFQAGTVRLEPGTTKNRKGRTFPFARLPDLERVLLEQREATTALERERGEIIPWVFHRSGRPIETFRTAWRGACRRAGVAGRFVHDFRRTAVRRLSRAGVPQSQAMELVGMKTASIYRRYDIPAERDLEDAVAKVAAQLAVDQGERAVVLIGSGRKTATKPLP